MPRDEIRLIGMETGQEQMAVAARLGLTLLPPAENEGATGSAAAGVFVDRPIDAPLLQKRLAALVRSGGEPAVLLLVGHKIPYGFADRMAEGLDVPVEVVRLCLWEGENRALIGGDHRGRWVHRLRRHLAERGLISLLCRCIEVDEAVRHLPLYLAWKQRFYLQLGERCDASGARLEVVAQALGMDARIGQGWLCREAATPEWEREIVAWLARQCGKVREKTKVDRLAFWGPKRLWNAIAMHVPGVREVRLYDPAEAEKTNEPSLLEDTLAQADLLVIADADQRIRELGLHVIVSLMRQPFVIDACSCYPLSEAEGFAIPYRTLGQNTNVWEWNGLE
ncbi:hypothetical protein G3578_15190 [Brevibacillus sp. SYP-B805]|uniref:hypothetical protein n=1 Tax=Brevibacillus sp. SYP-B805 TaxID=1578199 RepID=UPI0013ED31EF|nr:hypothetical protein [Brevibacillus sp. SYP-B805]NGQ96508.1 hypothetical protein [Brevibacillus sp. SYP-B805]